MKIKILAIAIMLIIVSSVFVASANVKQNENIESNSNDDIIDIKVAIYTDEKEDEEFYSPYRRTRYFVYALRDYEWKVGDKTYQFTVDFFTTRDLYKGKLTKENYDVLLYPPDSVDTTISRSFSRMQPRNIMERTLIKRFIEQGGGYFGTCAGSMVAGSIVNEPKSFFFERLYNSICLGISAVDIKIDELTMPLLCQLNGHPPESIGVGGAYLWYSGWNQTNYSVNYHTGVCVDVPISHGNPIFDDHIGATQKIRWIGGPALMIPDDSDREITVLARFPTEEISDNESTDIHYWRYTGGIRGLISGMLRKGELHYFQDMGLLLNAYCFASDWECMEDKPVETDFSNKPFMVSEIYPNDNQARIVRCTGHPEHNVWWGGYIEESEDDDNNNQYEAFYRWKHVKPEDETPEDEFSYNYWILRRSVAWASQKVPDSDLPSVYGESEVCDFEGESCPLEFNISCNVKLEEEPIELDLYYRNSTDNVNWSEWTLFGTDNNGSDGFSFEFDSPNGTGFYEFYSIRRVLIDEEIETERIPPGADSAVFLG